MTRPLRLWLDDERPAPDDTWTRCLDPGAAMDVVMQHLVNGGAWTDAALDHDMGHALNGMDFVEWMAKTRTWPRLKPTVHSANTVAAPRMQALIDRAGPYNTDGTLRGVKRAVVVHPEMATHTHMSCPDPACCTCWCPGCVTEWKAASKPLDGDCPVHGRS